MKVLVTGVSGYIASALVPELLNEGYKVKGVDLVDCNFKEIEFVKGDLRNLELMSKELKGTDTVINLGAAVPPSPLDNEMDSINSRGACNLAILCRKIGVRRYLFSSTTSVYGDGVYLNEWSKLSKGKTSHAPSTSYVSGKITAENFILSLSNDMFYPTIFRFATVFGASSKIGWQSLFNDFVRISVQKKELEVKYINAYRPLCHVKDIAKGIMLILGLPNDTTSGQIYNIGGINTTKNDIINEIIRYVPDLKVKDLGGNERGYSVCFNRIEDLGFRCSKTVGDGVKELVGVLNDIRVL